MEGARLVEVVWGGREDGSAACGRNALRDSKADSRSGGSLVDVVQTTEERPGDLSRYIVRSRIAVATTSTSFGDGSRRSLGLTSPRI